MDSLQKQVITLNHKVDVLYEMIDQLSEKVSEALSKSKAAAIQGGTPAPLGVSNSRYAYKSYSNQSPVMEHKDVLVDTNSVDSNSHSSEKDLSPTIQIQRLTAQLTAAYNRIAALEEQLLSQRIHS
ncbi:hypothetical protein H6F78_23105 [Coleofasciculus sp. FACHB-64]|nr:MULTISPECIES: hypothetical protein [unclassified Coleofasciculus]MBD1838994.1 hypothetical protein [Coleofasciculus sp. FACHB-501]MBD1890826.1 hypothetical protein [Coleofasciculus sp. FACHB-SPT9]MBD1896933.1 hypothetical protein [Coleofasciculus sp. FACHB-129]MBD1901223.1 hypothetical protein [Coleofasciculus sp. FACHB-125]MBD1944132.1 hypothetical protein [Coleofasciculus sp. FACHB-712]MBD2539912.1 hypothetical protein [Coleofasciculus sp. FACHB-SPT36]